MLLDTADIELLRLVGWFKNILYPREWTQTEMQFNQRIFRAY